MLLEAVAKFYGLVCDFTLQTISLPTKPLNFRFIVI